MNTEEAINLLDNLKGMIEDNQGNEYDRAFEIAIEALEKHEKLTKELKAMRRVANSFLCGDYRNGYIGAISYIEALLAAEVI